MSNSHLIDGVWLSPNCSKPRNHKITRITPHYMGGLLTAESCCEIFADRARQASANYCIGKDGEVWLNVEEENRAWTSGSSYNDNLAVTIECASYTDDDRNGVLPDATWNSLVRLCVDICLRNGISQLNFTGDDSGNLTMHKWYDNTDCPGEWFSSQFPRLAQEVNERLNGSPQPTPSTFGGIYQCMVNGLRVRTEPNLHSRVVAYYNAGDTVILDDWFEIADGYVWGRYTGMTSAQLRYVAVGRNTGKVEEDDFLIKL